MNAVPTALLRKTAELSETVTRPIPGSHKIHVQGSRVDIAVPMREIALADTPSMFGIEKNAPFAVYDTSGPYTDPAYCVDLAVGLPALRAPWISNRGDSEPLTDFTSPFTRRHATARELADVRFPNIPKPRRAISGANISQMHYARRGIITPEMEYISIREKQRMSAVGEAHLLKQHPGQSFGCLLY